MNNEKEFIEMRIVSINKIENEWKKLEKENSNLSPLQYYDYTKIMFKHYLLFAIRHFTIPMCACFYRNNECIAIAPLNKSILKKEVVSFGYYIGIAFNDWIYSSKISKEQLAFCVKLLIQKFKKVKLQCISDFSLLYKCLIDKIEPNQKNPNVCIFMEKYGSYEGYFSCLSKNNKQHIRTAYNRLKKDNRIVSLDYIDGKIVDSKLEKEIMDVYIARRNKRYKNISFFKELALRRYHYNTIALKEFDQTNLFVLRIDGECAGFIESFITFDGKYIIAPRITSNTKFAKYSPGIIMINEIMKLLYERNLICNLDLSIGDERYKTDMGGDLFYTYNFIVGENQ